MNDDNKPLTNDDAVLRMLGGANFGPNASLTLPSGEKLGGDEAQAMTSLYADSSGMRAANRHRDLQRDEVPVEQLMLLPATVHQYLLWLDGFVSNRGVPTHDYGYAFNHERWQYAPMGFAVNGECGARAAHVIVEHGAEVTNPNPWKPFGGWGHNAVFEMDGYKASRDFWVPIYSDPEFEPYRAMMRKR